MVPLAKGDGLSGNHEPKDQQSQETETPAPYVFFIYGGNGLPMRRFGFQTPPPEPSDFEAYTAWYRRHYGPKLYATVLGKVMSVPETYDPDTYDPNDQIPGTPEPDPYSPETYAAWGRKRFGEEWYRLRKRMLEERNFYLEDDEVYKERQRALRIVEHEVERRPFKPDHDGGERLDIGWRRVWVRLSKELSNPAPSTSSKDDDNSDTDPPTPEPSGPTPIPDDEWELLERDRKSGMFDEEEYQFEKFFLKDELIDKVRAEREDEPGDKKAREKRELIVSFRDVDTSRFDLERDHLKNHKNLPKQGWTREQIDAEYEAEVALHEWRKTSPEPSGSGPHGKIVTPEERDAMDIWSQNLTAAKIRFFGVLLPESPVPVWFPSIPEYEDVIKIWRKGIHGRVSRQQQREALSETEATGDASSRAEALQRIEYEERRDREELERAVERAKHAPLRWPSGGIYPRQIESQEDMDKTFHVWDQFGVPLARQNERARDYGFGERSVEREAVPQSPAPATAPAPQPPNRQRASRRLAGKSPEHGMVGGGQARPSLQQPSNTPRTRTSGSGSGTLSKKPTVVRGKNPRGIVKPGRAGTGRPNPKRSAKGSKG